MQLKVKTIGTGKQSFAAVTVFIFEDAPPPETGMTGRMDITAGSIISGLREMEDFSGRSNEVSILYPAASCNIKRIILIGLGKRKDFHREKLRGAAAKAGQTARAHKIRELAFAIDDDYLEMNCPEAAAAAAEGAILGLYRFLEYKTVKEEQEKDVETITLLLPEERRLAPVKAMAAKVEKICRAVYTTRDLVSRPSNDLTPSHLAGVAMEVVKKRGMVTVEVLGSPEMRQLGMNALLGVARGSREEPKFIVLHYRGTEEAMRPLVLVGKAITFDSGGISLKTAEKMDEMKSDMAGGAAVLGAIAAAADLKIPLNLVGLIPATENMPDGRAYKPGDILRTMSGKTVEVLNTDAEGRLILADALHYAQRYEPAAIIDIATLTGACVVALGDHVAGMMGTDAKVKELIRNAADWTGELVWELPLWDEYQEMVKSEIADFKNSAGRQGGAITAAAFLSKFAASAPWVHLDIAGPAWLTKDRSYCPKGASGFGVRLLVHFFENWIEVR